MTANQTIYLINQSPELLKAWRELDEPQKRSLIAECVRSDDCDIGKIIEEITDGQEDCFEEKSEIEIRLIFDQTLLFSQRRKANPVQYKKFTICL